jgi:hypothetical protein
MEIGLNLWYVYDATGTVHALRARLYVLPGNDEDKLAFMEAFASSDFLVARQFAIPETFLTGEEGKAPVFRVKDMEGPHALGVFEECMGTLLGELPPQTDMTHPPDPLVNVTPLFLDDQGKLHPVQGNGSEDA